MANIVEVIVQGTDSTNPAFKNATANTQRLAKEMQSFGSVLTRTASIASAFGNNVVADLSMQLGNVSMAAQGAQSAFAKLGAARFAGYGALVAVIAAAVWKVTSLTEAYEKQAVAEDAAMTVQDH